MDSASGSMQSSSGGDEEYDSRADSISSFLNQNSNNNHNPLSHHHVAGPMPPPQNHHSTMFEPISSFFDPLSTPSSSSSRSVPPLSNPNSLLNLDVVWSKNVRSEPNCTDLGGFMSASTLNQPQNRPNITSGQIPQPGTSNQSPVSELNQHNTNNQNSNVVGRNPKKRSRASRRAPTTVLTTDTSNFRAMVQEFTGIPAPPFTSTPFPRTRLDLYGTSSPSLRSAAAAAAHLEAAPPPHPSYLLRPFAQKIQQSTSSFLASSSIDAIVSATTTAYTNINTTTTPVSNSSSSINYQQLPQNLLNITMQNPILNFQPLLPTAKYPLPDSQILGSAAAGKSPQQQVSLENINPSGDSHLKMSNLLEDFGLGHGLQSMVPQQDLNESGPDRQHHQGLFMSINGNYNSSETLGSNGKIVNYSASSTSELHGDKVQENVVKARSEGMMESWICSSD